MQGDGTLGEPWTDTLTRCVGVGTDVAAGAGTGAAGAAGAGAGAAARPGPAVETWGVCWFVPVWRPVVRLDPKDRPAGCEAPTEHMGS